jgi:hypothetical protein
MTQLRYGGMGVFQYSHTNQKGTNHMQSNNPTKTMDKLKNKRDYNWPEIFSSLFVRLSLEQKL